MKEKPRAVITARESHDGTNGTSVNRRIRLRDQERSAIAPDIKRAMSVGFALFLDYGLRGVSKVQGSHCRHGGHRLLETGHHGPSHGVSGLRAGCEDRTIFEATLVCRCTLGSAVPGVVS